jgi:hypothetical protein
LSTNPTAHMGRQSSVNERYNEAAAINETPMACSCGSTHFFKLSSEQYNNNGYATAQFRSLSSNTESAYICLCGNVFPINEPVNVRATGTSRAKFLNSLKTAIDYQKKNNPQGLAQGFVSIEEHKASLETIAELQERVDWLMITVETLAGHVAVEDEDEEGAEGDTSANQESYLGEKTVEAIESADTKVKHAGSGLEVARAAKAAKKAAAIAAVNGGAQV